METKNLTANQLKKIFLHLQKTHKIEHPRVYCFDIDLNVLFEDLQYYLCRADMLDFLDLTSEKFDYYEENKKEIPLGLFANMLYLKQVVDYCRNHKPIDYYYAYQ